MATEFGWYDDVRMSTLLKSRILERSYLFHGKCIDNLNRVVMCEMEITHEYDDPLYDAFSDEIF